MTDRLKKEFRRGLDWFSVHFLRSLCSCAAKEMKTSFLSRARRLLLPGLLSWIFLSPIRAVDNEVIVVSPHWDGIKDETARAFSAWHEVKYGQPATIRWREAGGGASQIVRFLRAEYQTNPSADIDVLYGGGVDPFLDLEKDGLLTRFDPPADILALIPAQLNGMNIVDPNHEWFGAALSGFGIITNERVREAVGLPEVHTWVDLTDPRLAGWISASDPRASGSALAIYEIILQSYGWEKGWAVLMEMSGNARNFLSSSAASAVEVGIGDAAYGVAIDTYGQAQAGYYGSGNVSFVLPEGRTVITPDSIAILKNPPHPELARHFVEFVLSREGQLLWMLPKGSPGGATRSLINRMSVQPALYDELAGKTPILTNPFKMHSDFVYSAQLGSRRRAILSVLIAAWMIDTHDLLAPAWKALNSPTAQKLSEARQQTLLAQLIAPPCSETELLRLADTDWKNPVKRTALVNQWQSEALDRYKSVLAQINSK
jgi:ABC-type Fe3+ transport system substrate-binding protein